MIRIIGCGHRNTFGIIGRILRIAQAVITVVIIATGPDDNSAVVIGNIV